MKILNISIKQKYFDEILAGTKTHEYREIRPNNGKRYFRYLHEGREYTPQVDNDQIPDDDKPIELVPVKYDAIKLLTGAYSGKRPYMIIEVKEATVVILTDENGDDIVYEWSDGKEYLAAEMDYTLGRIIEVSEGVTIPAGRDEVAAKTEEALQAELAAEAGEGA